MRKGLRGISFLLMLLMAGMLLCGCQKGSNDITAIVDKEAAKQEERTSKEENIQDCTLHVVTMMGENGPNASRYNVVVEEFIKNHSNVKIIDASATSNTDWKVQMEADFTMGREPDVFQYFTDVGAINILKTDKFVTLEEMQKEDPRIAANTSKQALEQTRSPLDGINYAVPTTGYWEGLYCNADLFELFKLELPTTWEKLLKAVKVFNEKGVVPISVALNDIPNYWIESLLLTASTTEEYTTVPSEAPDSWIEGLGKMKELYEAGAFAVDVTTNDNEMAGKKFRGKRAAMQLEGSWYLNEIYDQKYTTVCAFPRWEGASAEEGSAIQGFSSGFYITKKAWENPAKRKAALDFVYANTCDEQILKYWGGSGICSVPVPEGGSYTKLQKDGMIYAASITNPVSPIDSRITPEAFNEIKNQIVPIAKGTITAKEAIENMLMINSR